MHHLPLCFASGGRPALSVGGGAVWAWCMMPMSAACAPRFTQIYLIVVGGGDGGPQLKTSEQYSLRAERDSVLPPKCD